MVEFLFLGACILKYNNNIIDMSSSPVVCPLCSRMIAENDKKSIECDGCVKWLHKRCAGISDELFKAVSNNPGEISWFCSLCKSGKNSQKPQHMDKVLSMLEDLKADNKVIKQQYDTIALKFEALNERLSENIKTLVATEISKVEANFDKLRVSMLNNDVVYSSKLKKLEHMENEIDKLHRAARRSDILISGIPIECKDLKSVFLDICKILKFQIDPIDIISCFRLGGKNHVVLVKIASVFKRDKLMKSYWAFSGLKLSQVRPALNIHSRIYFNDNLSPLMSVMFNYAKILKKTAVIKGFSIGNGFISIINANNDMFKLYSIEELKEAFSQNQQNSDAANVQVVDVTEVVSANPAT